MNVVPSVNGGDRLSCERCWEHRPTVQRTMGPDYHPASHTKVDSSQISVRKVSYSVNCVCVCVCVCVYVRERERERARERDSGRGRTS